VALGLGFLWKSQSCLDMADQSSFAIPKTPLTLQMSGVVDANG